MVKRVRRRPSFAVAGIKYPYLWLSLVLFLLTSVGIFSSRAQNLFLAKAGKTSEMKHREPLPENPVYGPLARSVHFRNIPPSRGKTASPDSLTSIEPGFSWGGWSDAEWWIPEDPDLSSEAYWLMESTRTASTGRSQYPDLYPKLQSRDIDPQAIMSNFITMGVVDLLDDLSDREVEGAAEKNAPEANPFDKALNEVTNEENEPANDLEAGSDILEEAAESDPTNSESSNSEETDSEAPDSAMSKEEANKADEVIGGGGSPINSNLLFIGSFGGRPLATAIGTVQLSFLGPSLNNTIFIELEGAGKQSFDLDVVLRDLSNQESAAFGDLDSDGCIDMVITNQTTHKAHIFKSDRYGNYEAAGAIFGGLGPKAAVISDFNSDGLQDIAVALQLSKRIVVDGKGLRKFIHIPSSYVDEEFSSMVPYDFDGDGLMDILLSDYQNPAAFVYLNQGRGLFAESDSLALQEIPYLQSRVDLDADGIEDTVYIQCLGNNISVVMINGANGTISNLGNMTLDSSLCFVVGDFNLDGVVDVALAHRR